MSREPTASFSLGRKWSLSLSVLVGSLAVVALVVMTNYLAARRYQRFNLSLAAQIRLSSQTQRLVAGVTNEVKATIYFDRAEPLYPFTWGLLKEYQFLNPKILVEVVDYTREPGAAALVKTRYKLNQLTDKNLVVFDCQGRTKIIYENELSTLDLEPLMSGRSKEVKRTHFKGEPLFTSAIASVTNPRQLKAYFLQGHREHRPDSDEPLMGYARFASVLKESNIQFDTLRWPPATDVPADCSLLIIAGPTQPLLPEELEKIDRYLKQGGRLLVLFNYLSLEKLTGLEGLLANWGVDVGVNVVIEQKRFTVTGQDMVVSGFGTHPLIKPFVQSSLYLVLPRAISKARSSAAAADAPKVEVLAATSDGARVLTDIRKGPTYHASPNDYVGQVPLMVAAEKGSIAGVSADRGATRLVVIGESIFLGNETIDKTANHEFASHVINWLLARDEMLPGLGPKPIREYKLVMTRGQAAAANWILLVVMPGGILVIGFLVWMRRRR